MAKAAAKRAPFQGIREITPDPRLESDPYAIYLMQKGAEMLEAGNRSKKDH